MKTKEEYEEETKRLARFRDYLLSEDSDKNDDAIWLANYITEKCGVPLKKEKE